MTGVATVCIVELTTSDDAPRHETKERFIGKCNVGACPQFRRSKLARLCDTWTGPLDFDHLATATFPDPRIDAVPAGGQILAPLLCLCAVDAVVVDHQFVVDP